MVMHKIYLARVKFELIEYQILNLDFFNVFFSGWSSSGKNISYKTWYHALIRLHQIAN